MKVTITPWMPAPADAPRPCFAIGDIHGMDGHFEAIQAAISTIIRDEGLDDVLLVRLGDYVDRGPSSLGVLRRARLGLGIKGVEEHNLRGNHEQMLSIFLDRPDDIGMLYLWLRNGGYAVAEEFGWSHDKAMRCPWGFREALRGVLGEEGVAFLLGLETSVRCGPYLFVHAGIDPFGEVDKFLDVDWRDFPESDADTERSPFWIRDAFLSWNAPLPDDIVVIHGHTITKNPDVRPCRVNIDTGCFRGGPLTAIELRGREMRLLMASDGQD